MHWLEAPALHMHVKKNLIQNFPIPAGWGCVFKVMNMQIKAYPLYCPGTQNNKYNFQQGRNH